MDELRKLTLGVDLQQGHGLFDNLPIPQDLKTTVMEWQRLSWFTVEGSQEVFVNNIGMKPGDPSADVLFAFVFFCLHTRHLEDLKMRGLLEDVSASNCSIVPQEEDQGSTEVGGSRPSWTT